MAVVQGSYRKWDTDSLVPETKIADVGKLISLENLLVRKVTWFMLPTTSAPLILSRAFGADHMTRIKYIYSRLPITYSHILTSRDSTHSLTFWLSETAWLCQLLTHSSIHTTWVRIYSATFFFPAFWAGRVLVLNTASDISSNPEKDKQPTREKTRLPKIHL